MKIPPAVGLPLIVPAADSVSPGGSEPEMIDQPMIGNRAFTTESVAEYGTLISPEGKEDVVITGLESMLRAIVPEAVCPWASVTDTLKLKFPGAVGVPLTVAVVEEVVNVSPGGSAPPVKVQLLGDIELVAVIVAAYGTLIVPEGKKVGSVICA